MPESDKNADGAQPSQAAAPLQRWERVLFSAAGLGIAIAGVFATFTTENEAGTVALVVIGGALLFVGLAGVQLLRARAGDWELEFARRLADHIPEIVEELPRDSAERLSRYLLDSGPPAARAAAAALGAASFERDVFTALQGWQASHPGSVVRRQAAVYGNAVADFLIDDGNGPILVEAKLSLGSPIAREAVQRLARSGARDPSARGLVVMTRDVGSAPRFLVDGSRVDDFPVFVGESHEIGGSRFSDWLNSL